MSGTHDGEVPPVQRGDRGHAEPFSESGDRCVHEAQPEVGVAVDQLDDAAVVVGVEVDELEPGAGDQSQEAALGGGPDSGVRSSRRLLGSPTR